MTENSRDNLGPNPDGTEQGKPKARKPLTEFELGRVAAVFELLAKWDKAAKGKAVSEPPSTVSPKSRASTPPATKDDWKPCRRVAFE